jgi:RNA polymerase sigma-70 factor (family 1)
MRSASAPKRETVFQEIYQSSFDPLFHFTLGLVREPEAAKDIVQQCFLNLWKTPFEAGGLEDARRRLFVFVRNLVFDHQRKEATRQRFLRQMESAEESATEMESIQNKETIRVIEQAIEALPEKRKRIFKLSRIEGLSHEEISVRLSISKNTVNNQINSATEFLRERLVHVKS